MAESTFGYARPEDGAYIGYLVDGDGPIDIVWQTDWPGNVDLDRQDPLVGPWLDHLRSFARLITHDHRGVGLSSRERDVPTLEVRVDDLIAVLRATGTRKPVLGGALASGAVHVLLAAMRPTLPRALVWLEPCARYSWASDYPWGSTHEQLELEREFLGLWGTEGYVRASAEDQESAGNPTTHSDMAFEALRTRNACTPDVAARITQMWSEIDVRGVLGAVKTPTLLLVHEGRGGSVEEAEYIASQMPAAEVRTLPGTAWSADDWPAWVEQVRDFIGVPHQHPSMDTVLSTVLFTDIVDSTARQASLGDLAWRELVGRHHAIVREALTTWNGEENDLAGDGFYTSFDGPTRAIRCALDIAERVRDVGLEIRAGIHTGDCELIEGKPGGLTVSVGARVAAKAGPSEVLVSQTVRDLVAGSGLTFEDAGEHDLKGVPDRWRLYRVVA